MPSKGTDPFNRVELESQVLCAALRQSWLKRDKVGTVISIRELSHLFPDLLPPTEDKSSTNKENYYEVLGVRPQSGSAVLIAAYFGAVRNFLKSKNARDHKAQYNSILNAGFVLRKPRLRLSHDLVVARRWFTEDADSSEPELPTDSLDYEIQQAESEDINPQIKQEVEKLPGFQAAPTDSLAASAPQAVPTSSTEAFPSDFVFDESQLQKPQPELPLPSAIRLLEAAHLITALEVQALTAQIQFAPNVPVEQLILNAGYANLNELASLSLAQDLLAKQKITMAQFQVAMYDERSSGLRMAESLQVRGWLETEVQNPVEDMKQNES